MPSNIREDCFAYKDEPKRCVALTKLYCALSDKPCPFYKPTIKREAVIKHVRHSANKTTY